jgi:methylmalonyl-CoA/ethylmalonyl-CoA epimerase
MILGIDHVGVLTSDLSRAGEQLEGLGLAKVDGGVAEAYGVACEFYQLTDDPSGVAVELVAPVTEASAIGNRLKKSGPGPYHVALEVDDVEEEMARLVGRGFVMVDTAPCAGARPGMQVAFLYLGKPTGLLVELVQYAERRRNS